MESAAALKQHVNSGGCRRIEPLENHAQGGTLLSSLRISAHRWAQSRVELEARAEPVRLFFKQPQFAYAASSTLLSGKLVVTKKGQSMVTGRKSKARVTTTAHDERRLEIILHSADLFDKVGYHKMTMQMLADEAGMGKPTLYHYFPSKAEILFEMHQIHMDALLGDLNADAETCADNAELLVKACASALRQIAEHPGYVRAFMDHYSDLEDKHRKQIRKRRDEYLERIRDIITDGMSSGRFQKLDPDVTVFAFLGICNWAYKWYPSMAEASPPDVMAKKLCQVILDGIKRQK